MYISDMMTRLTAPHEMRTTSWAVGAALKHAHSTLPWNVIVPIVMAVFFFGIFTTVYIMMRRPSFGEGVAKRDAASTALESANRP